MMVPEESARMIQENVEKQLDKTYYREEPMLWKKEQLLKYLVHWF